MSLLRFFFSPLDPNADSVVGVEDEALRRALMLGTNLVLLTGPQSTSKTSLAWAFCQSVCYASMDDSAYIVCDRKRLERGIASPNLTEGSSMNAAVWRRVSIKFRLTVFFLFFGVSLFTSLRRYVESAKEVIELLSCLHELPPPAPKCIVLDLDWTALLLSKTEVGKTLGMAMALLAEYAEFAKRFNCTCIVTDNGTDSLVDQILRRYLTSVVSLSNLTSSSIVCLMSANDRKIKYSLANNTLALNLVL